MAFFYDEANPPTLLDALKAVALNDPDRATSWNGIGFSGQDTHFANRLADCDRLSPKQEVYAAKFVRKYRKQIAAAFVVGVALKGKAREAAVDSFLCALKWEHPTFDFSREVPAEKPKVRGKVNALVAEASGALKGFVIRFPYDAELVDAVKKLPNRSFKNDGDKRWVTPGTAADKSAVLALATTYNLEMTPATRAILEA